MQDSNNGPNEGNEANEANEGKRFGFWTSALESATSWLPVKFSRGVTDVSKGPVDQYGTPIPQPPPDGDIEYFKDINLSGFNAYEKETTIYGELCVRHSTKHSHLKGCMPKKDDGANWHSIPVYETLMAIVNKLGNGDNDAGKEELKKMIAKKDRMKAKHLAHCAQIQKTKNGRLEALNEWLEVEQALGSTIDSYPKYEEVMKGMGVTTDDINEVTGVRTWLSGKGVRYQNVSWEHIWAPSDIMKSSIVRLYTTNKKLATDRRVSELRRKMPVDQRDN